MFRRVLSSLLTVRATGRPFPSHSPSGGAVLVGSTGFRRVGREYLGLSRFRLHKIAEREFQAAEVGMIVVTNGEGNVDGVARQKRRLLQAFGHAPTQGVENNSRFPLLSAQLSAHSAGFRAARNYSAIWMTTRSGEDGDRQ